MKRIDVVTSISLVPIDYLMLVAAGMTSYALRYQGIITRYRPVFFDYPFAEFFPSLLIIALIGTLIFALSGSYRIASNYGAFDVFSKVFLGVSTTILLVIVAVFLKRELFSSRFVVVLAWVVAILYVFIGRFVVFKIKSLLLKRGVGANNLVLIGSGKVVDDITLYFTSRPKLGHRVKSTVSAFNNEAKQKLIAMRQRDEVDEVLETRDVVGKEELFELINFCHEHNISFRYVASLYETKAINFETDSIAGYPIIQINKTPLTGWGRVYKRTLDVVIAGIGLLILWPLFVVIALMIRFDSRGPVLVSLERVGRGGRIFILYKFRSMIEHAHLFKETVIPLNERGDGPLFKMKDDPRVTTVGRLLRRSSFDELPQLWNVLRGDMSLVGPRPHEPQEVQQYDKKYRTLLNIKPGITGLAQVSGRSNLSFDDEAKLDTYYIENWSLPLDIRIFLRTLVVIFKFSDAA